jgi:hypothetical protein
MLLGDAIYGCGYCKILLADVNAAADDTTDTYRRRHCSFVAYGNARTPSRAAFEGMVRPSWYCLHGALPVTRPPGHCGRTSFSRRLVQTTIKHVLQQCANNHNGGNSNGSGEE